VTEPSATAPPKVSVCVPTYNRAPLLKTFLATIFAQTYPNFEVIISDNCSTDATPEIIGAISDPRLRYYRNDTNIGPYANMNRLLELAAGEYVSIVHDDDLYSPQFLEREADMLARHPGVGMVHCAAREIDADGTPRQIVRAYVTTCVRPGQAEFLRYLEGHNVCCSSVMARRSLLQQAGPFDGRYLCADFLMWMKLALHADVGYIADPLLDMRVHPDTVTSWLDPARWHREFVTLLEEGFALGVSKDASLARRRTAIFRRASRAQGRRFVIAALAAASRGDFELAGGFATVLERLRPIGLPALYATVPRLFMNRFGRTVLTAAARVRRARARRQAQSYAGRAARA
jgi:glycosyltransferase involved in cell wall biosynthesis